MPNDSRPIKEKRVKDRVKKLLDEYNCYRFMPVQSGYGGVALDFICCHHGRFFSVETKAPGKHLSARQELIMDTINDAGGAVFVIGEAAIYKDKEHKKLETFSGMGALEAWLLLAP